MRNRDSALREVVVMHYGSADREAFRRVGRALHRGAWQEVHGADTDLSPAARLRAVSADLGACRDYLLAIAREAREDFEAREEEVRLAQLAGRQARALLVLVGEIRRALAVAEPEPTP